ncbi:MAG: DUF3794 domain-containing protein [Limnochordia bacterium]
MSLRIEEQQVRTEAFIGRNAGQAVAEGIVRIPAPLPSVGEVLKVRGTPRIDEAKVKEGGDEVVIAGTVSLHGIYGADVDPGEEGSGQVYGVDWPDALQFSCTLDIPGVEEEGIIEPWAWVEAIDVSLDDEGRALEVEVLLQVSAAAYVQSTMSFISGVQAKAPHKVKAEGKRLTLEDGVGRAWFEGAVNANLEIPGGWVDVERVLDVLAMPTVTGCEARSGRAIIRGQTRFAILYWSTEGGGRPVLFSAPEGTPFEFILEMEELEVGMDLNCRCRPVGVSAQIVSGREVAVEANLEMYLRGCRRRQLTMLREVTSEGDLVPTRKDVLRVDQFIAQEERQTVVERTLNLPGDLPRVADILHVEAQAQVGAITITEGRLAVEGEARVGLYYRTGREDPYPLRFAGWSEPISFTLAVDVAGAHPGMEGVAELAVIDARAFLPNEEQVTVALVVGGALSGSTSRLRKRQSSKRWP